MSLEKLIQDNERLSSALNSYFGVMKEFGIDLEQAEIDEISRKIYENYALYQKTHMVQVRTHDYFKVFAWVPYITIEVFEESKKNINEDQKDALIKVAIIKLNELLATHGKTIKDDWQDKIFSLARNGLRLGMNKVSIERNGLYISFKSFFSMEDVPEEYTWKSSVDGHFEDDGSFDLGS